jgi:SAM-dependent methyltransferase
MNEPQRSRVTTVEPEIRAAVRSMLPLNPTTRLLALGGTGVLDVAAVAGIAHAALVADAPWPEGTASIAIRADPLRLPFAAGLFDAALAMLPLDAAGLRELWRVLAPAGILIAVVPRRSLIPHRAGLGGEPRTTWTRVAGVHVVRAAKRDGLAPVGSGGTPARVRLAAAT